jgi:hypothetical protein
MAELLGAGGLGGGAASFLGEFIKSRFQRAESAADRLATREEAERTALRDAYFELYAAYNHVFVLVPTMLADVKTQESWGSVLEVPRPFLTSLAGTLTMFVVVALVERSLMAPAKA